MSARNLLLLVALGLAGCSAGMAAPDTGPEPKAGGAAHKWKVSRLELEALDEQGPPQDRPPIGTTPDRPVVKNPEPNDPGHNDPGHVGQATATSGSGRLSRESIEATLGDSEDTLGQCAEGYSTFAARIMVAPNGVVSDARVTQSAPDDPRMRDCLTEALRRMRFPSSTGMVPLSFSLAIEPY